jgi:hypothetical protein
MELRKGHKSNPRIMAAGEAWETCDPQPVYASFEPMRRARSLTAAGSG